MTKKHVYNKEIQPKKGFLVTKDLTKVTWTTGRNYYVDILKTFGEKHIMKLCCEQNCQYPVVYFHSMDYLYSTTAIQAGFDSKIMQARVYFFDEEDAMAFKLRWM